MLRLHELLVLLVSFPTTETQNTGLPLPGKEMVDYICQYLSNVRERRVTPDVQPGYMRAHLPDSAPMDPDSWDNIFGDIEKVIMPGVVHWQSPHMHAYFPALTSWPSLLGDMLADAINCLGFTWASSPACTELEMNVMDWLAKMLGLPDKFLHHHPDSVGGGVLQSTVSESTLVALLAARKNRILEMKVSEPDTDESSLNSRLIAYASDQAHSSVEKAGLISLVKMKFLPVDENFSLRGETLKKAIAEDRKKGLVPVFVCATLGTTGVCAFDNLSELGPICDAEGLWLHIDAAYAGTAFVCPEFRLFLNGIEYADSFTFNPSKWMMVHFDCTGFWVKDKCKLHQTFSVNPLYLRHPNSGAAVDFMHWQIPLSRRFRSLKLWFVIRSFGVKKLQDHVRHGTETAKFFESLVKSDPLFEIPAKRHLGLVVFRIKGPNWLTEKLLKELSNSGRVFLIPATIRDKFIIRFTVTSQFTTREDILQDWNIIQHAAARIVSQNCGLHCISSGDGPGIPNTIVEPSSDAISNASQLSPDGGKYKTPSRKIVVQPKKLAASPSTCAISQGDLLDDCFPEDAQDVTKHKLTSFLFSYLSVQGKKKTARSLSCNSVPVTGGLEPCNPKAAATDKKESHENTRILSRLPEEVMMFKKSAFKKLIKFYSVPSFPECSIQCGLQLPCCPLQAIV
ncbi:histidine decarboxylase isoform X1 [Pezoporus wallicus]|uniref:histidine decarboxylase isoform X1 n=1 Tax=Pezoporus wallicus TaxID=35540 RepID=UPI00254EBCCD|nr:histidine decarboxylase isoform X1 [Pezoporus wallicus]XP_061302854.1 histidine decarboxylase isoform X1 [Pezoporus flaviventris]